MQKQGDIPKSSHSRLAPAEAARPALLPVSQPDLQPDPQRRRKLHAGHFAFMRSVVQGVDLRASWDRYLQVEGKATDLRVVRSTIAWIRDEFAAAARREDRFGTARLVLVDVGRIAMPAAVLPTLEAFAEARGME